MNTREKPLRRTPVTTRNLALFATLLAAGAVSGKEAVPKVGTPWKEAVSWIVPKPSSERERLGSFIVQRRAKDAALAARLVFRAEGERSHVSMSPTDIAAVHTRLSEAGVVAHCDMHSHPDKVSPPSAEDVREFKKETQLLKQTHPHVIHIMSVADRMGVWFVREFMTEAEQAGMLRNERGIRKETGTQHVERVVGLWQRKNFQDAHISVDAVRASPEFTLLRSAFAEAGVYVTYVTHEEALKDPCGMRTLYTLDR